METKPTSGIYNCRTCKEPKDVSQLSFNRTYNKKTGLYKYYPSNCKCCESNRRQKYLRNDYYHSYYIDNQDKMRLQVKEYYQANKEKLNKRRVVLLNIQNAKKREAKRKAKEAEAEKENIADEVVNEVN